MVLRFLLYRIIISKLLLCCVLEGLKVTLNVEELSKKQTNPSAMTYLFSCWLITVRALNMEV